MAKARRTASRKGNATRRAKQTPRAVRRICNLVPSKNTETDWQFGDALGASLTGAVAALPPSVDLRASWWAIGDQEDTGSCVGWAMADGVVRYHMVKAGRLDKDLLLSPRFVWMGSKETDEFTQRPETFIEGAGTSLKAAVEICKKYGAVTMSMLPFHIATKMYSGNENAFFAAAAQRRISSYFNLGKNLNEWKSWLATNGPILAGFSVDSTYQNATETHGNLDTFMPNTVLGGHAIAIVGYLPNGRFIIRNSWGTSWGDRGFAYASPAYIAAGFFDESYGVTV